MLTKKQIAKIEKLIIESFAKTFNSIKRVDENELMPSTSVENSHYQALVGKPIHVWRYYHDNEGEFEGVITGFEIKYGKNYYTSEKEVEDVAVLIKTNEGKTIEYVLRPFEIESLMKNGKNERSYSSEGHRITIK